MWRKGKVLAVLVGMEIDTAAKESTLEIPLKKKLGIKPPYDQTVPLLGTHPEKSKTEKTHAPQCSSKHFTIARTGKPPRCPLQMNG